MGNVVRTYKYRLKDRRAAKFLREHAYAVNQVWNWCVAQHEDAIARYRAGGPPREWLSDFQLMKQCNGVGATLGIMQMTASMVCRSFALARDKHKLIRFRSSFGLKRALGWVPFHAASYRVIGNTITYRGRKYRFFGSRRRPLPYPRKSGAFVEDQRGRWWVCICVEVPAKRPLATGRAIGIDLGLKDFAALSDGRKIAAPQHFRCLEEKYAVAQRAKNVRRARAIALKIANQRRDFHHKLSTELARSYALIAVGNVNSQRLARNRRLAKSVHDAGWSAFRDMLRYKSPGFVEVDEAFTTQACSSCGALPPERPKGIAGLGIREWDCSHCGASHDRDVNAARNILALGRSVTPPEEGSRKRIGTGGLGNRAPAIVGHA